jgi:hypothetical protein
MAKKIRWLITHHPIELFWRTAEKFAEELEVMCPGEFEIEIHTTKSFNEKYNNKLSGFNFRKPDIKNLEYTDDARETIDSKQNSQKWEDMFSALEESEFEMSQTSVSFIGNYCDKSFVGLDLPFLFRDHDHVSNTLDNEIGDEFLANITKKRDIVGLGFTYSGGYRIVGATESVTNLEDLKKLKMFTYTTPGKELFSLLGVDTTKIGELTKEDLENTDHSGSIETTYLRFSGQHILKTDHSMYMTSILVSKKFFDDLTDYQKECYRAVAKKVAQFERGWSIEDARKYEETAKEKGISIIELSEEDRKTLVNTAKKTYINLKKVSGFDPVLIKKIILN